MGLARAQSRIQKEFPLAFGSEQVQKALYYKGKNAEVVGAAIQADDADAEEQAQIDADIVTYGITPDQQKRMLQRNLPAGVQRWDPNLAKPIIAEAKLAQEATKETKAETKTKEKEAASKLDEYNKAFAAYEELVATGPSAEPSDLAKARATARGAAAVLGLPKVANEEELRNFKSGEKVLAPDGITIITVP